MSKPKNMTETQEAAWRQSEKTRRATPEYRAKALARAQRYYIKNKHKVIAANRDARSTEGGRIRRNEIERAALAASEERQQKARDRQAAWRATEDGRQKSRAKSARYAERIRLNAEFDAFLAGIDSCEEGHAAC